MTYELTRVLAAVEWLRAQPFSKRADIVAIVEADYAPTYAAMLRSLLNQHVSGVHFMAECSKAVPDRPGVNKPRDGGRRYQQVLSTLLAQDRISFAHGGSFPDGAREELLRQLRDFRLTQASAATSAREARYVFSGKASGKDDLAVAMQQAAYWSVFFMASTRPRYQAARGEPARLISGMRGVPGVAEAMALKGLSEAARKRARSVASAMLAGAGPPQRRRLG